MTKFSLISITCFLLALHSVLGRSSEEGGRRNQTKHSGGSRGHRRGGMTQTFGGAVGGGLGSGGFSGQQGTFGGQNGLPSGFGGGPSDGNFRGFGGGGSPGFNNGRSSFPAQGSSAGNFRGFGSPINHASFPGFEGGSRGGQFGGNRGDPFNQGRGKRSISEAEMQQLYNLTMNKDHALETLFTALNRTQKMQVLNIVMNASLSRDQLEMAGDKWASQQGSTVQQDYEQYKQSALQWIDRTKQVHSEVAANLSSSARDVDQKIMSILMNGSLNIAQQCAQLVPLLANTSKQIKMELENVFGPFPCEANQHFGHRGHGGGHQRHFKGHSRGDFGGANQETTFGNRRNGMFDDSSNRETFSNRGLGRASGRRGGGQMGGFGPRMQGGGPGENPLGGLQNVPFPGGDRNMGNGFSQGQQQQGLANGQFRF